MSDKLFLGILDNSDISEQFTVVSNQLARLPGAECAADIKSLVLAISYVGEGEDLSRDDFGLACKELDEQFRVIKRKLDLLRGELVKGNFGDKLVFMIKGKINSHSINVDSEDDRTQKHSRTLGLALSTAILYRQRIESEILATKDMILIFDEIRLNVVPLWKLMFSSPSIELSRDNYSEYCNTIIESLDELGNY